MKTVVAVVVAVENITILIIIIVGPPCMTAIINVVIHTVFINSDNFKLFV